MTTQTAPAVVPRRVLLLVKSASAVEADLLKATVSKTIVVPAYTRKDGVLVPAHTKVVHYDPAKEHTSVLSGNGSHSQKQAHKKLSKLGHWGSLPDDHKLAHILSSATNIQQKASASAAVSGWKAAMLAGKAPSSSQQAAFSALVDSDPGKAAELSKQVADAIGPKKFLELANVNPAPATSNDIDPPVDIPAAAVAPTYTAMPAMGGLGDEGTVIFVHANFAGAEKLLGLDAGSLADDDSTTYTVKNASGQTFSVYKHGGGLSVRTSGKNKDHASAQALAYHLEKNAQKAAPAPAPAAAASAPLVTGADGKPKFFYHGGAGNVGSADLKPLTFFTPDKDAALSYVGNNSEDEKLHAVHLAIGKLATPEDVKKAANKVGLTGDDVGVDEEYHAGYEYLSPHLNPKVDKVLAELKKQGFDGAHFPTDFKLSGELMPGGSWVVFGKGQVVPASGDHGLQGVGAWAHLSQYKSQHPMFITAQAKAWLADNPGKGAELSSTLVDLGHLDIAKKLGIYTPPSFASPQGKSSALADVLKNPAAAKMHASMNVQGGWYANLDDAGKAKWLAENAKADTGPKEGDTKPAADGGTLVLKDGHWVKQGDPAVGYVKGDKFKFSTALEKVNSGTWEIYNTSGDLIHLKKVGAKVPNSSNTVNIPKGTLDQALAAGTAAKVGADGDMESKLKTTDDYLPSKKAASSTTTGYKVTDDVNAVPMVHATTGDDVVASIKQSGFNLSNNSMYGKGVYFSDKDLSQSGGKYKTSLQVKLKPHKQLVLDSDLDVPTALQKITGLSSGHLGSDKAREAFLAAGIGSLRFPVDGETYTVVLDPALIELPKAKFGPVGQALAAAVNPKLAQIPWDAQLLPAENSNAKSHNGQIAKIKAMAEAGDAAGLQAYVDAKAGAKQTYAKKQHLLAATALAALTEHSVPAAPAATIEPPKPPTGIEEHSEAGAYLADAVYGLNYKDLPTLQDVITALQGEKPGHDEHKVLQFAKDAYKHLAGAPTAKHSADVAPAAANPSAAELVPMMEAMNAAGSATAAKKVALRYLSAFPGSQLAINQVNDALVIAGYKDLATAHAQKGQPGIENYQPKAAPAAGPVEVKAAVFHHTEDGHNKFWSVSTSGKVVKTTYGKIGSKGQATEKTFGSVAEADAYAAKIGKEKQAKGYKYAGTTTHEYAAPAPDASAAAVVGKPAKPQFGADMHADYQKTADSFESFINDGNVDQLKLHYWGLSSSIDPGTKQIAAYAKAGLESLGVHPAYFAYNLGSKHVPESFKTKKQEMLAAVAAGDKSKVAAMKVGNAFHLKQAKAAYLNAFADLQQDGPKEGDTKQGADGMLVLKNGHWVKMGGQDSAAWSFTEKDPGFSGASTLTAELAGMAVYVAYDPDGATFEAGTMDLEDGEPDAEHFTSPKEVLDYLAKKVGASVEIPSLGQVEKLAGKVSGEQYAPKVKKPAPSVVASPYEGMDNWKQTGPQGGSNPGGRFRDADGVEWYCKFPQDEDTAKAEVLAAKLYGALGISGQDCKLVTKGGKIGIASRWIDVSKATPAKLAKLDGVASGFGADAWLGNWDVVGLGYDNLQVGPDGKAHRVDAGGSLMYRAQGGKKQFGATVLEIDSLRDKAINPQAAAVFGKMTQADITASVAKVLALPDQSIASLVSQYGPGDETAKQELVQILIARKADLAAKFPKAAKQPKKRIDPTKLQVDGAALPKPHDFENWNGPGQGLSSKAHVNKANAGVEYGILGVAQLGNLPVLKDFQYSVIDKETGMPTGKYLPIANHPSKHVSQYHEDLVQILDEIANPPEPLKVFQETDVSTVEQLAASLPPKKFGTTVGSVNSNEKLGFWVVLGVAPSAAKFRPKQLVEFTSSAIAAGKEKFKHGSALAKHFIQSVQASGSYNDLFRNGKSHDHSGNSLADVAKAAMAHASTQPEGTTLYRWQKMTDAMVDKILSAPDGTVFQATGPMCTSYHPTATKHFGQHRLKVRYAKGAKAVDSFGSGGFKSEMEVTTLPNARFVVLKKEMVPDTEHGNPNGKRLEIEVLMLPPDLGL